MSGCIVSRYKCPDVQITVCPGINCPDVLCPEVKCTDVLRGCCVRIKMSGCFVSRYKMSGCIVSRYKMSGCKYYVQICMKCSAVLCYDMYEMSRCTRILAGSKMSGHTTATGDTIPYIRKNYSIVVRCICSYKGIFFYNCVGSFKSINITIFLEVLVYYDSRIKNKRFFLF